MAPVSPAVLQVVVADDDERVRAALVSLLSAEPDFTVLAEVADGEAAVAAASDGAATLVLVDVRMPGGGAPLVSRLVALPSRPVVVALSANADATTWTQLVGAGAAGYLLKGSVAADLPALLRRCAEGQLVVTVPGAVTALRRLLEPPD